MPKAGPVTATVDEVRDEFLAAVLEGFTREELEMQDRFMRRLFDNTKKAMERRKWS